MKKFFTLALLPCLIFIFATSGVYIWWQENAKPVSSDTKTKDFLIVRGRGASEIAQQLYAEGLIKNPLAFKFYIQVTGKTKSIQAGRYSLSPDHSLKDLVKLLVAGPKDLWVTIPEGLRREEIVEKFITGLGKEDLEKEIFREEFMQESSGLEGFLFPDTYLFPRETGALAVIKTMKGVFDKKVKEFESQISASRLSLKEIVTLASIIERETKKDEERPIVAGILLNRLKIGMAIQADATVQYVSANLKFKSQNSKIEKFWEPLSKKDLEIDSPYNTYKYKGLPPGPIANPGLSSLGAAIIPDKTDYLYYLHDTSGNIHFAKTLDEHNENVKNYLGR